ESARRRLFAAQLLLHRGGRPPSSHLFPYTTLFRSQVGLKEVPKGLITRPTLVWRLRADEGGERDIEVSYMTGGMDWTSMSRSPRSEEHTSELQSRFDLVCRLLLEKKKTNTCSPTVA